MFATRVHQSAYRLGSRMAQSPSFSTVRRALRIMAKIKRIDLRQGLSIEDGSRKHFIIVLDNIQTYAQQYNQRIGTTNQMITGTAATAVEMEDYQPGAFDLDPLLEQMEDRHRDELTLEKLMDDIDWKHLQMVSMLHWLQALVSFVPSLLSYKNDVMHLFATQASKFPINPSRHTKVHPLGTNGANEVSTQGIKEAVSDFLQQLGISNDTYGRKIIFFTGDGKSFEGMGKIKTYLSGEDGDFKSLRFLQPGLEVWHTKWTDLNRITSSHWGSAGFDKTDPSTLGFIARAINSPIPTNPKKTDFYPGTRLVELTLQGHMLHCWEYVVTINHYN